MSVAVGIAQPPGCPPGPLLATAKTIAGSATPQMAATTGSTAALGVRSSPATNSRLSSIPATKKKMVSSPSLAQVSNDRCRCSGVEGPMV